MRWPIWLVFRLPIRQRSPLQSRAMLVVNPSYAVGVIFYDFLVFFGTLIDVFPGILEYVEFKTACSPDQVT